MAALIGTSISDETIDLLALLIAHLLVHARVVKIAKANLRFSIYPTFRYGAEDLHDIWTHSHWGVSWISSNSTNR